MLQHACCVIHKLFTANVEQSLSTRIQHVLRVEVAEKYLVIHCTLLKVLFQGFASLINER